MKLFLPQIVRSLPGATTKEIGKTRAGHPLYAFNFRHPSVPSQRKLCAYGYPHPPEALGASAIYELALRLGRGQWPRGLEHWSFSFVFCASYDQAQHQKRAITAKKLSEMAYHIVPFSRVHDIDTQFPGFLSERSRRSRGHQDIPPESMALARWLVEEQPDIVVSLHSDDITGAYIYAWLAEDPDDDIEIYRNVLNRTLQAAQNAGDQLQSALPGDLTAAAVGMRVDNHWAACADAPVYEKHPAVDVTTFVANHLPQAWFLVPETGVFQLSGCDDMTPSRVKVPVRLLAGGLIAEDRESGLRWSPALIYSLAEEEQTSRSARRRAPNGNDQDYGLDQIDRRKDVLLTPPAGLYVARSIQTCLKIFAKFDDLEESIPMVADVPGADPFLALWRSERKDLERGGQRFVETLAVVAQEIGTHSATRGEERNHEALVFGHYSPIFAHMIRALRRYVRWVGREGLELAEELSERLHWLDRSAGAPKPIAAAAGSIIAMIEEFMRCREDFDGL